MSLNLNDLSDKMLGAAKDALKEKWPQVATTAKERFQELSQILVNIEKDKLSGQLDEDEANELFEMHKNGVKTALETVAGMGEIAAEAAINAALGAIKDIVNVALGWTLIP